MENEIMEQHHRRQDFLQKYLELVNCGIPDGRALLRDMSQIYESVRDREAYICIKEWHDVSHFSVNQSAKFLLLM